MYKMVTLRRENRVRMGVVGPNSWNKVMGVIYKSFSEKSIFEKNYRIDVSATRNYPGVSFVVRSEDELLDKFNYIGKNNLKDGFFGISFYNVDFFEKNINSVEYKIKNLERQVA
jgi:hypothetical protein